MPIIDLVKKDRRLRKLLKLLDKGSFKFDCNDHIKEIRTLHTNHRSAQLSVKDVMARFQSKVIGSVLHAQANRSRIVEIKIDAYRIHAKLDKHVGILRKHLKTTYNVQLNHMASTSSDRESILDNILEKAVSHIKDLKIVMDIADLAINDLDQQGWAHKTIVNVMEQSSERKSPKI